MKQPFFPKSLIFKSTGSSHIAAEFKLYNKVNIVMSNNRIFAGSRYQTSQGRTVNLTGTMTKRSPIFNHTTVDKVQTSPFANYNCKAGQSFLTESQTTISEDRMTQDAVRQLVKEQLAKVQASEEVNRKLMHTLQAQITDLKQRISEYEKENNMKLQQAALSLRGDFRTQAQKMGKDVQLQISNKLRSFFQKANLQLKKDILKTAEGEFLTIAEGEDLQNRLQALNERIDSFSALISKNKITQIPQKKQPIVLSEHIQSKISKLQKEFEQNKRHSTQLVSKVRGLEEWKQQEINKRSQKIMEQKIEHMRQKIKSIEYQIEKKFGRIQIKQAVNEGDINIIKEKLAQLQKGHEEQSMLFLDLSKKLSSRPQSEQADLSSSLVITQKQLDVTIDLTNEKSELLAKQQGVLKKQVYQLDSEGYLMDGDRKYLLTEDNKMIKLSQEQIDVLLSSKAIQIVEK